MLQVIKIQVAGKSCRSCRHQREELCQKAIKIKQQMDPCKFNHPARETNR